MGVCASSHIPSKQGINRLTQAQMGLLPSSSQPNGRPSTVKIIHIDGRLQEFKQSIVAKHILSQNPNLFLCSLESINIDSYIPQVPENEELQLGQIYFLLPISKFHFPISLSDLCTLAIRASIALSKNDVSSFSDGKNVRLRSSNGIKA
ncbi:hypothetical protein ACHQM5_023294 [Ranunculus cassubicifolius]